MHIQQEATFTDPFWLRKVTTYPHILAHINIVSR